MWPFSRSQTETRTEAAPEQRDVGTLASPSPWLAEIFGVNTSLAGVAVSAQSALRVPAVAAGVKALSEAVAILPLHAYRRNDDGSRQRDNDHPAFRLLNHDANPWTRGAQLRELLTADAIVYGNAFAVIVRDGQGEPQELHRVHPNGVSIEADRNTSEPLYRLNPSSGGQRVIPFADMLHIRAPSPLSSDSITGRSPILEAKEAVALAIVLEQHASRLFSNGARPSGLLSFARALTAEAAVKMRASWQNMAQTGGVAVLDQDAKFSQLTLSSVDGQFLELRMFAVSEIARALRVPPVLLMDYSRQTWSNAETGGQQFLTYSLSPWLLRWEAETTLKLVAVEDRTALFVEHLTDALLRVDFATRAAAYGQYRSMGAMTANEVRTGLNLPPLPDGNSLSNPYTSTGATDGGSNGE